MKHTVESSSQEKEKEKEGKKNLNNLGLAYIPKLVYYMNAAYYI